MDRSIPRTVARLAAVAGVALGAIAGCGDDTDGGAEGTGGDAEEVAESAGARAVAEAIRATLVAEDLEEGQHESDVAVLQEAVDDLPGEPDVTGIEDANGDGRDDDGKVEVLVDQEVACLSVASNGEVDVTGGEC